MTLKKYSENLLVFIAENPECLEMDVICYNKNEEGNKYEKVYYTPSKGFLDINGDFISENDGSANVEPINVVCIN